MQALLGAGMALIFVAISVVMTGPSFFLERGRVSGGDGVSVGGPDDDEVSGG